MAKPIDHSLWNSVELAYLKAKSIRGAAELTGLSKNGVAYILQQRGTTLLPRNRAGAQNSSIKAIRQGTPSAQVRDKVLMTEMYVVKRMSTTQIAKQLGCDGKTVWVGLQQCGIEVRTPSERVKGIPRPNAQGPNHRDWKGGITAWRKRVRRRLNPVFVRPVMERDGFACKSCSSKKKLVVHHVRPFAFIVQTVLGRGWTSTEQVIEDIVQEHTLEDGLTLCKSCHDLYHQENGK